MCIRDSTRRDEVARAISGGDVTFDGLTASTTYYYRARAIGIQTRDRDVQNSLWTPTTGYLSVTTEEMMSVIPPPDPDDTPTDPPRSLSVNITNLLSTTASVSYNFLAPADTEGVIGYTVDYVISHIGSSASAEGRVNLDGASRTRGQLDVSPLTPGEAYTAKVSVKSRGGAGYSESTQIHAIKGFVAPSS